MGKRRRRRRDRAGGLRAPCFASPLPPEIPRPAPRGVHRAAVGRSSDSWARRASLLPTSAASQGMAPQCWWRVRSQLPLRGSAGVARTRHRLPVLIPWLATTGTDGHNIVGQAGRVNTKCCVEQRWSMPCGFHGFALLRLVFLPAGRGEGARRACPVLDTGADEGQARSRLASGALRYQQNVVPIQRTKVSGLRSPLTHPLGTLSLFYGERE